MNIRKLALAALMMALGFSSLANAAKNDPKTAYIFGLHHRSTILQYTLLEFRK